MKKKRLIGIIASLLLLIPGIWAYAADGTSLITSSVSEVEAGKAYSFSVDLTQIPDTYTSYTLSIGVSPEISYLTTTESVSFTYNAVKKEYEIASSDLAGLTSLTVSAYLPATVTDGAAYTVTAAALDTSGASVGNALTFTAKAAAGEDGSGTGSNTGTTETPSAATTGTGAGGGTASASASAPASSGTGNTTYQGSYNNYLSALTVTGYELQADFQKTNDTYFITVPNDVTAVTVKATADDDGAAAKVAGDSDLAVGINKVLISVTAENGDVRTYRIYVTREDQS